MASMKYCDKHNQVGFLKKPEESTGFAEIVDFLKGSHIRYALTHNLTIHDSLVKQFWQTATASTLADGTLELRATIDTIEYTITEASVRSKLQLADASGISMLPNTEIFEGMGNMGYPADDQAVDQPSPSEPLPSSSHPPVLFVTTESEPTPVVEPTPHPQSPSPEPDSEPIEHTFEQPSPEHQALSPRQETKVDSLETELQQTKLTMGKALVKLVKKVKKMEDVLKRRHVVLPDSEDEDAEISSKQGRNLQKEGLDEMVRNMMKDKSEVFKTPTQSKTSGEEDISPTTLEAAKTLSKVASQRSKSVDKGKRYKRRKESKGKDIDTGFKDIDTGFEDISTGFEDISTGFEEVNTGGLGVSTGSGPVSSARGQREGKAPMIVEETQAPKRIRSKFSTEEAKIGCFMSIMLEANAKLTKSVLGKGYQKRDYAKKMARVSKSENQEVLCGRNYKGTVEKIWRRALDRNFKETKDCPQGDSETDKEESVEAMNPTPLTTKSDSVVNWKIFQQGQRSIYQIMRVNRADTVYMSFGAMVKDFTKEDLIELYRTMFDPPLNEDAIWSLPLQQKMYPLSKEVCQVMLKMKLLDGKINEVCYKLLKMIEKQAEIRK
ncbi:hypothetical protein Tco_0046412 [Tanacetum coccineum]